MTAIKKIYLLLFMSFSFIQTNWAQQKPTDLKIGDKLPDLVITGIINQQFDKVNLKDLYKDGLLIIDFWGTYCVPCLYEMKFLDSLKGKNPGKFNVLMVTPESKDVIDKFLARPNNKDIGTSNLILATSDTVLNKHFIHRSIPHNIWVDKNGIVRAITHGDQVNSKNILNFDNPGVLSNLKTKKDIMGFNSLRPFHLGDSTYTYRSVITPYIDGIGGGSTYKSFAGKTSRSFYYNTTIPHLYWAAYTHFNPQLRENLMEINTADSLHFFYPSNSRKSLLINSKYKDVDAWKKENEFCYELKLPQPVPDTVFRDYMFNDLSRQFPYLQVKVQNKDIPCTVVTKIRNNTLSANPGEHKTPRVFFEPRALRIRNAKIKDVLDFIFNTFGSKLIPDPFLVDIEPKEDTVFDADLDFPLDEQNPGIHPEMIISQLKNKGFLFHKAIRPYPILVINDLRE